MHFTLVGKLCCIWRCERSGSSRSQSKVIQGSNDGTLLFNFEHFLMPSFHYQQSLWPLSSGLPSCCWCFPHQFYGTSCLKIGSCISSHGDQNPKNTSYLQCWCTATCRSWHNKKDFGLSGVLLIASSYPSWAGTINQILNSNYRWLLLFHGKQQWKLS